MNDRVDDATQIAIGKVIERTSMWDDNRENIYTVYTIQSYTYHKQNSTSSLFNIVTLGGVVEDEAQLVSPAVEIQTGQEYIFFLSPSFSSSINVLLPPLIPSYQLFAYSQGALPLKRGAFHDYFGGKPIPFPTLVEYIENRTGFAAYSPNQSLGILAPNNQPISRRNGSQIRSTISITNGIGEATNTFYAGRIEEEHYMVITGTGFGKDIGTIQFSNSDNGGQSFTAISPASSDILNWTETEIRLKVPLASGTGKVQVYHNDQTFIGEQPIEILWSIKPIYSTYKNFEVSTRQFINFIDFDGLGGYSLQYNSTSGLASNAPAKAAFEKALAAWHCATGIHFTISPDNTVEEAVKDDISAIMFQSEMPIGVVAMTSSRYKASGSTSCDLMNTTWYLREFDMQFAHPDNMISGLSWSYDNEPAAINEFDFETISLHELGHAHGLGHINHADHSMYYAIENGVTKRSLANGEIEAGLYQMGRSKEENCISSKLPMKEHADFCGEQFHQDAAARIKVLLEGYYDADIGAMRTELASKNLLSLNQPFNKPPFNYTGTESLSSIPTDMVDWVLLSIRDATNYETVICENAAILKPDGTIMKTSGEDIISFDCANTGLYYLSITHQNHLSIVTNEPLQLDAAAPLIDFTNSVEAALGEAQQKSISNKAFLHSGDFDCNGVINNEDYNLWKINGASINVYSNADADGNGIINSLDYNLWKSNRSKIGMISEH